MGIRKQEIVGAYKPLEIHLSPLQTSPSTALVNGFLGPMDRSNSVNQICYKLVGEHFGIWSWEL